MLKKIVSSLLAFWNIATSGQSELPKKRIQSSKNMESIESPVFSKEKVDEYFFKAINYKKINFEHETDPDILRSYGEYDEGEYPLHLREEFLPNLYFYSTTCEVEVEFEIFLSLGITLSKKILFNNADFLQEYFINKYNTCFFYDKDLVLRTNDYGKFIDKITVKDFQDVVLPNLIPKLIFKVDTETTKRIYYNWNFFRSNGNYERKGVNLLYRFIDHLPYPNTSKVIENEKLQFYVYANIAELANFAPDIEFVGQEWNAKNFDDRYLNDIFEQSKETIYSNNVTYKFMIKAKSRFICNELKNDSKKIKSNLDVLNNWFFDEKQIPPFKIK